MLPAQVPREQSMQTPSCQVRMTAKFVALPGIGGAVAAREENVA
jgi:hypothetical protein